MEVLEVVAPISWNLGGVRARSTGLLLYCSTGLLYTGILDFALSNCIPGIDCAAPHLPPPTYTDASIIQY
jgi:hypothetical protein